MSVYKGRNGRRSSATTIFEGEVEESRPMVLGGSARVQDLEVEGSCPTALEAACACTGLSSRRGDDFEIIIAKTRGACVIAII
jgi:hypothetical protein